MTNDPATTPRVDVPPPAPAPAITPFTVVRDATDGRIHIVHGSGQHVMIRPDEVTLLIASLHRVHMAGSTSCIHADRYFVPAHDACVDCGHQRELSPRPAVPALDNEDNLRDLLGVVAGIQSQIDELAKAQLSSLEPPPAAPESIGALTRDYVDEAMRRLSGALRQYIRDEVDRQVAQAFLQRTGRLQRAWAALTGDKPSTRAATPPREAPAVPDHIARAAEQTLQGR